MGAESFLFHPSCKHGSRAISSTMGRIAMKICTDIQTLSPNHCISLPLTLMPTRSCHLWLLEKLLHQLVWNLVQTIVGPVWDGFYWLSEYIQKYFNVTRWTSTNFFTEKFMVHRGWTIVTLVTTTHSSTTFITFLLAVSLDWQLWCWLKCINSYLMCPWPTFILQDNL